MWNLTPTFRALGRRRRPDLGPLRAVPALRDADPRLLAELAPHADRLRLPPGRILARGGHTARELIVIVSGQAALLSEDGRTGIVSAGAQIGGDEVVGRCPHPATVVALTDVEVVAITAPAVLWANREGLLPVSQAREEVEPCIPTSWERSLRPVAATSNAR
ncbi:MAG TPA: cyclic nucleotide-binding domain-containing protein [Acidimicrobiales bacterium]|nr:cyclic nucleotide-binding domain-containing protein [Acidimicrobiales bacterium]